MADQPRHCTVTYQVGRTRAKEAQFLATHQSSAVVLRRLLQRVAQLAKASKHCRDVATVLHKSHHTQWSSYDNDVCVTNTPVHHASHLYTHSSLPAWR